MKNNRGLTLIEIIIVIAIILIVIAASYSVFALGNQSFIIGNRQYDVQSDVRIAVGYIENTVRYSTDLALIDIETENVFDPNYEYIIINEGSMIHFSDDPDDPIMVIASNLSDDYTFRGVSTTVDATKYQELEMIITGNDVDQSYTVTSQIALPNISLKNSSINVDENADINAIKFSKVPPAYTPTEPNNDNGNGENGGQFFITVTIQITHSNRDTSDYQVTYEGNNITTTDGPKKFVINNVHVNRNDLSLLIVRLPNSTILNTNSFTTEDTDLLITLANNQ